MPAERAGGACHDDATADGDEVDIAWHGPTIAGVSESGPLGGGNPFEGLPGFLGELMRMIQTQSQGAPSWETARQWAAQVSGATTGEGNIDPLERMRFEPLARVAELRVADVTGLATSVAGRPVAVVPVTRSEWVRRTVDAWRPLFDHLAAALRSTPAAPPEATVDPDLGMDPLAMFGPLLQALGPQMLVMQVGQLLGELAGTTLGQYDVPLPRPPSDELVVVAPNIDAFASEWSVPAEDLRLWLCLSQVAHHVVLGRPHVRARLDDLVRTYAGGFRMDPGAIEERFADIDPADPTSLPQLFAAPEVLLGAVVTAEQQDVLPQLDAVVSAVIGYVDHVMDVAGHNLIGSYGMLSEAVRRDRVELGAGERSLRHLLGVEAGRAQAERGAAFVAGVVERAGEDALPRLWASEASLPTPAEIDAPGLWLARLELDT